MFVLAVLLPSVAAIGGWLCGKNQAVVRAASMCWSIGAVLAFGPFAIALAKPSWLPATAPSVSGLVAGWSLAAFGAGAGLRKSQAADWRFVGGRVVAIVALVLLQVPAATFAVLYLSYATMSGR